MITAMTKNMAKASPIELAGLSTDEKPKKEFESYPILNASTFFEMDTGELYWYDEDSEAWIK